MIADPNAECAEVIDQEIKSEALLRLVRRTGDYRRHLADEWDRIVNEEASLALTQKSTFDLTSALHRLLNRMLNLAAQNEEVRECDREEWQHEILADLPIRNSDPTPT